MPEITFSDNFGAGFGTLMHKHAILLHARNVTFGADFGTFKHKLAILLHARNQIFGPLSGPVSGRRRISALFR